VLNQAGGNAQRMASGQLGKGIVSSQPGHQCLISWVFIQNTCNGEFLPGLCCLSLPFTGMPMTRFLLLMIALIMFPQVVETAYSPALPLIADAYAVSAGRAGQTLSVYFAAFAAGVLFWGWLCDSAGRRPAVLAGLAVYGLG